jgi:hypothetical protein
MRERSAPAGHRVRAPQEAGRFEAKNTKREKNTKIQEWIVRPDSGSMWRICSNTREQIHGRVAFSALPLKYIAPYRIGTARAV